jgi:S1-C subfamily serine protease
MIKTLLLFLLACTPPANAHLDLKLNINLKPEYDDSYAAELDPYAPKGLKVSYLSSIVVQVLDNGNLAGSGSGNYFRLGKSRFILTAAHVVSNQSEIILIEKSGKPTAAKVVYLDPLNDLAILIPQQKLRHTKAIPFRRDINNQMGEKVYHCGHPAFTGWHLSEGILSGLRPDTLLVNTFAWPGSSGSVLFDESGRVVGILSAVRIDAPFMIPDLVEHIVLVSNIKMLDSQTLKAALRNGQ